MDRRHFEILIYWHESRSNECCHIYHVIAIYGIAQVRKMVQLYIWYRHENFTCIICVFGIMLVYWVRAPLVLNFPAKFAFGREWPGPMITVSLTGHSDFLLAWINLYPSMNK